MNQIKKILCFVLAMVMVFGLIACDNTVATDPTTTTGNGGTNTGNGKVTYTVTVKTNGGMAMEGLNLYLYADEALLDMKAAAGTDAKGVASFNVEAGTYYVSIQGAPKGYDVKASYPLSGTNTNITLTSSLVKDESVTSTVFEIGDVMYDFTYQDHTRAICAECNELNELVYYVEYEDGSRATMYASDCQACGASLDNATYPEYTLSEVLAEKKLVVLNFWYTTCSACLSEFPVIEQAYQMYGEDVEIIALNPYPTDSVGSMVTFEPNNGIELSFPLSKVENAFNNQKFINPLTGAASEGYPTSVFVDRYGVICAIEVGSMTSLTQWACVFDHFVADDYNQIIVDTLDKLIERIHPTYDQPSDEEIAEAIKVGDFTVDFHPEEDDEYSWPFIVTEKDGRTCLKASNQLMYESYAILYAEIEMKAGDVVAFDYLISSEGGADFLHVIVDGEAIYSISGEGTEWKSAYCWVAEEDGTYQVALIYIKDTDTDKGDDTVYVDNLRIVGVSDIDTASYIPRQAAVEQADGNFNYADIFYNEADGYYHVGSVNGPLLLANLMGYTQMLEDSFVYYEAVLGKFVVDGVDYRYEIEPFCTVASNSSLNGFCTVTKELAVLLQKFASIYGFDGHDLEWLKLCKYYMAYGTNGEQLEDPNAGLAWFSAFEAVLGNGYVDENGNGQNFFYYDGRPIMPRGMWARFVPNKTGVYRITSHTDYKEGLDAWIFDRNGNILYEYNSGEMMEGMYADQFNISMTVFLMAGVDYYIDIAMYDVYGVGYITYDIEFVGESAQVFKQCCPGPFTYDLVSGKTIIGPHPNVIMGEDGYYHEDLGRDANGNQIYGSIIYAYFTGPTSVISTPITQMINMGGFDFSKTETDLEILAYLNQHNGDVEATDAFLHELWGSDYAANAELYQIEDVFAGIYHGTGVDLSGELATYLDKMITGSFDNELYGCVAVDARLAELLQMVMDKYTFEGVEYSWLKMCYYYDYLGQA